MPTPDVQAIHEKFAALEPVLDERARRLWAAAEARMIGRGGISHVAEATGLSRIIIRAGLKELDHSGRVRRPEEPAARTRRPGGGRKPLTAHDPQLVRALETLVDPTTPGGPMQPLRWTCRSAARLAAELQALGHRVSERSVNRLLHGLGYSLQSNRRTIEASDHPDRDAQFRYINRHAKAFQTRGQPVVSVNIKKRELVGRFRGGGRQWQPEADPEAVRFHHFADNESGAAIQSGLDYRSPDTGWVSVGIDQDTAELAVESLRRWWAHLGSRVFPCATQLLITAAGGGSDACRCRLWKVELQGLADETGLRTSVCHFPRGSSKWSRIEHRDALPPRGETAGPPPGKPRGGGQPDRGHGDGGRSVDPDGVGPEQRFAGPRGDGRGDEEPLDQAG